RLERRGTRLRASCRHRQLPALRLLRRWVARCRMTPYEVYFYSSGVVEEGWGPRELCLNRANSIIGYSLGGLLSCALMITAAALFLPGGIEPKYIGTVALGSNVPLGTIGLILALVGILFAVGG